MVYVGIDLHRKRSHVSVVDERGEELLSRRLVNDPARFERNLGRFRTMDRSRMGRRGPQMGSCEAGWAGAGRDRRVCAGICARVILVGVVDVVRSR